MARTGHNYYVNDSSLAGNQYTTAARQKQRQFPPPRPPMPMASLNAVLKRV